jgi:hypothetical protein
MAANSSQYLQRSAYGGFLLDRMFSFPAMLYLRHAASVSALGSNKMLMRSQVVTVEWQKGTDIVDSGRLNYVWPLNVIPTCRSSLETRLRGCVDKAEVGVYVCILLVGSQDSPIKIMLAASSHHRAGFHTMVLEPESPCILNGSGP